MKNNSKDSHIHLSPCCCYLVSLTNVLLLQNEHLKANISSWKLGASVIMNPAIEKIMVNQEQCRFDISLLAWIWPGNGHFTKLWLYSIMNKLFSATWGCSISSLIFVIFIQENKGVWSSSNVCVATIFVFKVLLSWTGLLFEETGVELIGVKLFFAEMFLLFP